MGSAEAGGRQPAGGLHEMKKYRSCDPHPALRATLSQWERDWPEECPSPSGRGWQDLDQSNKMSIELILFYIFAAIALTSAILVVTTRNVVHSATFLGGTLFAVAGLFLTLHAEFLAGVQVIVYVGGILVLF